MERSESDNPYHALRRFVAESEQVSPQRFIGRVGFIVGLLYGVPQALVAVAHDLPLQWIIAIGRYAVYLCVMLFVWWVAVHRRRFSVLMTATHITLGFAVGDLIGFLFAVVVATIQTGGHYAAAYFDAGWATVVSGPFIITVIMTPFRFLGAAGLVALGRLLVDKGRRARPDAASAISVD